MTVYALMLLVAPALRWLVFGFGLIAALILLAAEVALWVGVHLWARWIRRRRGLPPLPPLWRKQSPPQH
jgi:membrane protein implicated in regulation of membrane protease activity